MQESKCSAEDISGFVAESNTFLHKLLLQQMLCEWPAKLCDISSFLMQK